MKPDGPQRESYLRRFRIGVVLICLLAVPAVFHSKSAIESLFNRPAKWLSEDVAEKREFDSFAKHFDISDVVMCAWDSSDLDSPDLLAADELLTLISQQSPTRSTLADKQLAWIGRWRDNVIEECGGVPLKWVRNGRETIDRMMASPSNFSRASSIKRLGSVLVGPDGKQTCLVISLSDTGTRHRRFVFASIRKAIGRLTDRPSDAIAIVGTPMDGAVVDSESIRTIQRFAPPSAIIAAVICLCCLRSLALTLSIIVVAVVGEGLALAMVYYSGTEMNAILIVLPPLVFVLTTSSGIHLSNYFLDVIRENPHQDCSSAARSAMRAGVAPCCLATGTTVIGMLSLLLVRLEPVRIFGVVASLSVSLTLGLLVMILPGAMILSARKRKSKPELGIGNDSEQSSRHQRSLVADWVRRRMAKPWPTVALFTLVGVGMSFGLTRLESSVNIPRMFLPASDIRTQYRWFEEHIGPTVSGELLVKFNSQGNDFDPLTRVKTVANVQRALMKHEKIEATMSALNFMPPIPSGRSLRSTAARSVARSLIVDQDSSLRRLGLIASYGGQQVWRVSIRMPQSEDADLGSQVDSILDTAKVSIEASTEPAELTLTGGVMIVQKAQQVLLRDLFRSFMTAFGVIAIVMMLMLRSVCGGLLAMLPNLFPTVTLFGLMGMIGLPLDIGSVMSASVALGIAVDDTVHLLSRYGSRRARGLGQIRAAYGALSQCGFAMLQTTLVCGIALMAYWFSDFVPTSRFALFMLGLLGSALLGVTFLLPSMMCTFLGKWLARSIGADAEATIFSDDASDV